MIYFGQNKREPSIDMFRGFIILGMLTSTFFGISQAVKDIIPAIISHSDYNGITIAEFFAPAFVFLMGMSAVGSFERRKAADGVGKARLHFFYKGCVLIALQAIMNQPTQVFTGQTKVMWGILSAVGIAVLWALPFIGRKLVTRACGFVGYAAVLTVLSLCFGFEEIIRSFTQGGIIGGLGWSCMFLFGTIVNELFVRKKGVWIVLGVSALLTVGGLLLDSVIPFSKRAVSLSYVVMTCGVSGLAFIVFFLLAEVWGEKTNFMIWVGKNAILFFLCDQLLAAVLGLDLLVFIYPTATAFTVALGAAINIAVWSALAYLLNKKKIYLKI